MTAAVEGATSHGGGGVLHLGLGRGDRAVLRGPGRPPPARGVTVRLLFDHLGSRGIPGYKEFVASARGTRIDWHPMLPVASAQGSVPAARPAQPPQDPGRRRADRRSWARRTSSSPATTSRRTTRRAGVGRAGRPRRRARGRTRCARCSPQDWYTETDERIGSRDRPPDSGDPPPRRRRRPGAAERARLRHREQPAALHRAHLLGPDDGSRSPAPTSSRTSRCCTP